MIMYQPLQNMLKDIISLCRQIQVLRNILYYSPENLIETVFDATQFSLISLVIKYPNLSSTFLQAFMQIIFPYRKTVDQNTFRQVIRPEFLSSNPIQNQHSINQNPSLILQLLIKSIYNKSLKTQQLIQYLTHNTQTLPNTNTNFIKIINQKIHITDPSYYSQKMQLSQLQTKLFIYNFSSSRLDTSDKECMNMKQQDNQFQQENVNCSLQWTLSHSKKTLDSRSTDAMDVPESVQIFKEILLITLNRISTLKPIITKFTTNVPYQIYQELMIQGYCKFISHQSPQTTNILKNQNIRIHTLKKKDFDLKQFVSVMIILGMPKQYIPTLESFFYKFSAHGLISFQTIYSILKLSHCNSNSYSHSDIEITFSHHNSTNFQQLLIQYLQLLQEQKLLKQSLKSLGIKQILKLYQSINLQKTNNISQKQILSFLQLNNQHATQDIQSCLTSLFGSSQISLKLFTSQFIIY